MFDCRTYKKQRIFYFFPFLYFYKCHFFNKKQLLIFMFLGFARKITMSIKSNVKFSFGVLTSSTYQWVLWVDTDENLSEGVLFAKIVNQSSNNLRFHDCIWNNSNVIFHTNRYMILEGNIGLVIFNKFPSRYLSCRFNGF